jgi:hypothetical protein
MKGSRRLIRSGAAPSPGDIRAPRDVRKSSLSTSSRVMRPVLLRSISSPCLIDICRTGGPCFRTDNLANNLCGKASEDNTVPGRRMLCIRAMPSQRSRKKIKSLLTRSTDPGKRFLHG